MLLVLNTAFMTANLGLQTAEKRFLKDLDAKSKHSENVLKTVDELCQEANVDVLDIDTVAVVTGPGSFTGLRIGTAIAKALGCVKNEIKFISLSSLETMAYIIAKKKVCDEKFACIINALSGKYFICEFDAHGRKISEERMVEESEVLALKSPIFALKGDVRGIEVREIEIDGESLLDFALVREKDEDFVALEELLPKYIRASQAEDNLIKNCQKTSEN